MYVYMTQFLFLKKDKCTSLQIKRTRSRQTVNIGYLQVLGENRKEQYNGLHRPLTVLSCII